MIRTRNTPKIRRLARLEAKLESAVDAIGAALSEAEGVLYRVDEILLGLRRIGGKAKAELGRVRDRIIAEGGLVDD